MRYGKFSQPYSQYPVLARAYVRIRLSLVYNLLSQWPFSSATVGVKANTDSQNLLLIEVDEIGGGQEMAKKDNTKIEVKFGAKRIPGTLKRGLKYTRSLSRGG